MEKVEIPLSIKKYANFVEQVIDKDVNNNNSTFNDLVGKMDSAEEISLYMHRKCKNVDDRLVDLNKELQASFDEQLERVSSLPNEKEYFRLNSKNRRVLKEKLSETMVPCYMHVGNIMSEYGILEALVERSNKTFYNAGAPFLRITVEEAKREFDKKECSKSSYSVLAMKTAFFINKIVKCIDSLEYDSMFYEDSLNSKCDRDKRNKFLSRLKTDFVKKVCEYEKNLGEDIEGTKIFDDFEKIYNGLFGEYFKKLDFKKEFENVEYYEIQKDYIYNNKLEFTSTVFASLIDLKSERDLREWGFCIDKNGEVLVGMNIYGYPMPVTIHITKEMLEEVQASYMKSQKILPTYESLLTAQGKIFRTNFLFRTNEKQREQLKNAYKENRDDPCLKFFMEQVSSRESNNKREYISFDDLLK